jgi:hypothetical protein
LQHEESYQDGQIQHRLPISYKCSSEGCDPKPPCKDCICKYCEGAFGPTFAGEECQHGRCEEGPEDANEDNTTESRWAKAYRTTKDPEVYDDTLDFHMVANYLWKVEGSS